MTERVVAKPLIRDERVAGARIRRSFHHSSRRVGWSAHAARNASTVTQGTVVVEVAAGRAVRVDPCYPVQGVVGIAEQGEVWVFYRRQFAVDAPISSRTGIVGFIIVGPRPALGCDL